jgi:gentisate 1,2-dioxygenase
MTEKLLDKARLSEEALYYEYTSAVNPVMPPVPCELYKGELHRSGPTRIIPFDLSQTLECNGTATGPTVSACYLRICKGENLISSANASSQLFYVIRGKGLSKSEHGAIEWSEGDLFVLPMSGPINHIAHEDSAIYHVNDEPLISYLGAKPVSAKFPPTLYPAAAIMSELEKVDQQPGAKNRNRDAIILGNKTIKGIKSATHTLWAAVVLVGVGQIQRPHRHNSIAVDIVVSAEPGCYTLLGLAVDTAGNIINPQRVDWQPGSAFVTPPGLWHGHYNESGHPAMVIAVQEAGFYEYLRTLDIRFTGQMHDTSE